MSSDAVGTSVAALIGYRALGRHGDLGVVTRTKRHSGSSIIVIRGGTTDRLLFEVPATRVTEILHWQRTIAVDADVTDFVPRITKDGEVELRLET